MPLPNITLNPNQSVTVTATPEDANGNPGTYTGSKPSWAGPSGITITPAADGFSSVIAAGLATGVFQVDVTSQPVSFGPNIVNSFDVTVQEQPATQLVFSFGSPQ